MTSGSDQRRFQRCGRTAALLALLAGGITLSAEAQQTPTAPVPSRPVQPVASDPIPAPDVLWQQVAAAYRSAPIAERVRIGVLRPKTANDDAGSSSSPGTGDPDRLALEEFLRSGRAAGIDEQRGVIFLKIAPIAGGASDPPGTGVAPGAAIRLEMGDLRIFGEPGKLLAVRSSVPGGVVIKTFEGPLSIPQLESLMPPLMLPQLALALEGGDGGFLPGLSRVAWESVHRVKDGTGSNFIMRGRAAGIGGSGGDRDIEAVIDERTSRLARVRVTPGATASGDQAGSAALEIFISPIEAGDPSSWRIDTVGRIAVESLDRLRSAPPAPEAAPVAQTSAIKVGDPLPQLYLYNARTESWASEKSAAGRFAGVVPEEAGEFRAVLVVFVPSGESAKERVASDAMGRAVEAITAVLADDAAPGAAGNARPRVYAAGVALGELDRFEDSRRRAGRDWAMIPTADDRTVGASASRIALLCSPAGRGMLARLGSGVSPVIVIADQSLTIRHIEEVGDTRAADLAAHLRGALRQGS